MALILFSEELDKQRGSQGTGDSSQVIVIYLIIKENLGLSNLSKGGQAICQGARPPGTQDDNISVEMNIIYLFTVETYIWVILKRPFNFKSNCKNPYIITRKVTIRNFPVGHSLLDDNDLNIFYA